MVLKPIAETTSTWLLFALMEKAPFSSDAVITVVPLTRMVALASGDPSSAFLTTPVSVFSCADNILVARRRKKLSTRFLDLQSLPAAIAIVLMLKLIVCLGID
jgi:hypothetical protein